MQIIFGDEVCFDFSYENRIHSPFVFFETMKKYSLIGILWLLIIGFWIRWRWNKSNYWTYTWTMFTKQATSLLSYLPDNVDQVMHVKITPETEQFLVQTNEWIDPTEFLNVLKTIEEVAVAQAPQWTDSVYSAILIKWKENFTIDSVTKIGLIYLDTWYVSQEIAQWVRLYGDALSVDNFANVMTPLTTKPEIKDILATAQKQQASVLFYSTPWSQLWNDPLALAFAQKLQYTALYGTPSLEASKWTFVLQFTGTNFTRSDTVFDPVHDDAMSDKTVLYIEWKELLSAFGVSESQFSLAFPLLLGQTTNGAWNLLSSEQIATLYTALNKNIGILMDTTDSAIWFGLSLHFGDEKLYDSLISLQPLLRALITPLSWSGQITEQRDETNWTLSVDLDPVLLSWATNNSWSFSLPLLSLNKENWNTSLSILPSLTPAPKSQQQTLISSDTLLSFRYNPSALTENVWNNPFLTNFIDQVSLFWTGVMLWNVVLDSKKQQLITTFETK